MAPAESSCPIVAIDFETSGFEEHYACAIGLARIEADKVAGVHGTLLRPPSSYVRFTNIHGLTWPMLKNAPTFAEAWPEISAFMAGARFLVAHNAIFDRRVLNACLAWAGIASCSKLFLCTLKGARQTVLAKPHSLARLCAHFAIPLNHHEAVSDALACAKLYLRLRAMNISDGQMLLRQTQPRHFFDSKA